MPNLEGIWDYKKKNSINCLYQWWHVVFTCTIVSIIWKKKTYFEQKLKSIENNVHISNKFSIYNKTDNFSDHPKIGNFSDNPNGNRVDKGVIYFF